MSSQRRWRTSGGERTGGPTQLLAPLAVGLMAVVACSSMPAAEIGVMDWNNDNSSGKWSEVMVNALAGNFSCAKLEIDTKPGKPKIEKVEIDIWDDLNGNGQRDPGEPGESFSDTLDPPVSHHEMTDISGNLGGSPSNPQYRVEVSTVGAGGIVYSGSIG